MSAGRSDANGNDASGSDASRGDENTLDLSGEVCPYTFVRAKLRLEELPLGAELLIVVDHPPAAVNVPRSLTGEGHEVLSVEPHGAGWHIRARKCTQHRLAK